MPVSVPSSITKRFGAWLMTISTPSSSASSSSHGEALKKLRGRRAITLMSLPPRRRDERQQSIAVLPTPMISTRSPILSMCPKATDSSQSMPMWIRSLSWRPGTSRSLPRGAPVPTKTASKSCCEQAAQARHRGVVAEVDAHVDDRGDLLVEHLGGQAERRDVGAHQAAGLIVLLEDDHLVAERHEVVRDRERRGPGADAGDALAVLLARDRAGAVR